MTYTFLILSCLILGSVFSTVSAQQKDDPWLENLLRAQASPLLQKVLDNPDTYQYQLIYTRIDRDKNNRPQFKNQYLHTNRHQYFNPASTVKLPTALVALEKLNSLNVSDLNKYTPMLTDSAYSRQSAVKTDTTAENGLPSVAHYIKKIFLVSDNDAYNRLYEFVGQQRLNESLWQKGYKDVRITRRFTPMSEDENRHTNPIRFVQNGQVVYAQPAAQSQVSFDFSKRIHIGKAHYDWDDNLINEPLDFTRHNNFPLDDLRQMVQAVMFPESVPATQRFNLTPDDYTFLYKYMSMLPRESDFPKYDTTEFFDSYTKFFNYKATKSSIPEYVRIYNKPGWSYGFLTDAAYVADTKNGVEYMLSAVIYVNSDGVLNDNKYEYDEIGYPFFKEVGEIIYKYELGRARKYKPDFNRLISEEQ